MISSFYCYIFYYIYSGFNAYIILGLFFMFYALSPKRSVYKVSLSLYLLWLIVTIKLVRALPPNEFFKIFVKTESL